MNKAADNGSADEAPQDDAGVLRAKDIMPPYGNKLEQGPKKRRAKAAKKATSSSRKKRKQPAADAIEQLGAQEPASGRNAPAASPKTKRRTAEVPSFDLAEKIMAEQRRSTATTRRGPGRKVQTPSKPARDRAMDYAIGQPVPVAFEQSLIIAEIVARDIEKLCRRNSNRGVQGAGF
ncbi:MAG: hypothetical protein JSU70_10245 [Phycisphaerales bacterium]|nr:MAG: hypothetical protein JSU70_10245 [Phycisphaerales bacterium]